MPEYLDESINLQLVQAVDVRGRQISYLWAMQIEYVDLLDPRRTKLPTTLSRIRSGSNDLMRLPAASPNVPALVEITKVLRSSDFNAMPRRLSLRPSHNSTRSQNDDTLLPRA